MSIKFSTGRNPDSDFHPEKPVGPSAAGKDLDLRVLAKFHEFFHAVTEPAPLAAMVVAGPAFSLVRNPVMSWLLSKPAGLWTRGLGLRMGAAAAGLPGEVAAFAATQRAVQHVLQPGTLDWSPEAVAREAGGLGLTLALFKMHGRVAQILLPKQLQAYRSAAAGAGMYSGIVHSHLWEERLGWREGMAWDQTLGESLVTFLQLKSMGHLTQRMMGPRYGAWVASLEARAEREIQSSKDKGSSWGDTFGFLEASVNSGAISIPIKIPIPDNSAWEMKNNNEGDGPPPQKIGKVIPFRRDTPTSTIPPHHDTPLVPPPNQVGAAQGLRDNDILKMVSLFQNLLPGRKALRPEPNIPNGGNAWERLEKLESNLGSLEPKLFDPEVLFQAYLGFLNGLPKLTPRNSMARHIPLELLLQEVLPAYLIIRRNHLPLAYEELADPLPLDHQHRDIWRATTYLAMRLLEGVEATDQLLYETSSHFQRVAPKGRVPIIAQGMGQMAFLRINRDRSLQEFRDFLLKEELPKPQALLGMEAFLEYPEDLMGGLDRLADGKIKPTEEIPSVGAQVLTILHAARRAGR